MSKRTGLTVGMGIVFFSFSAVISGNASAAVATPATEIANPFNSASADIKLQQYARGGRRGGGGARRGGGGKRPGAGRPGGRPGAGRPGNRPGAGRPGNRPGGRPGNRPNRNVNVNVRHRGYGWRGARWGAVAFGVTMGAAIVVAANTPPPAPDPSLCWTWSNSALTRGYWYYCSGN